MDSLYKVYLVQCFSRIHFPRPIVSSSQKHQIFGRWNYHSEFGAQRYVFQFDL